MMESVNTAGNVQKNSMGMSKSVRGTYSRPVQRVLANNVAIKVAAAVQPVLIDLLPQLTTLFSRLIKIILIQVI